MGLRLHAAEDVVTAGVVAAATPGDVRVRDALRRAMIARIATVSAGGWPLIMPLYFVVLDGRIYMNNAATSPTVRNIAVNPGVLVLLQVREGEVVRVRGTAQYLRDAVTMKRVTRASIPKYMLRPRALWFWLRNLTRIGTRSQYTRERPDTGMIEVTPESYAVDPA
ncbi:MAG: pyridoxamine 5'-phosphate oxidase family protein [Chloroflexi bacterium]|nr:pyridoxamine 5'-phosphate oxidase family protein [Chloroflexota bacterium]